MSTQSTLLCIHREPAQLSLLKEEGYRLITSTNGGDGLRLLMSRGADAIILDYHLGLLDGVLHGSVIAAEIKQLRPKLPIVMLADHVELPEGALKSVDALVAKSDGPHFLLATVHFVLNVKLAHRHEGKPRAETRAHLRRPAGSREGAEHWQANTPQLDETPFSPRVWRSIRNGSVQF
jgi:DNA-binding response OmpR family regulator